MSILFIALIPMTVKAEESSYTYIYDYWGDVQDSPDLYTCSKVFTSSDLGLDVKLKNPQSLYIKNEKIYICDSGNNRIIECERTSSTTIEVIRIIDSFTGGDGPTTFSNPTDIAISDEGEFFIADQGNARILKLNSNLEYMFHHFYRSR